MSRHSARSSPAADALPPREAPPSPRDLQETISVQNALHCLQGAYRRGLDMNALLLQHGIAPSLMESPLARLPVPRFARLLGHLQRRMRDEFVGLGHHPVRPGTFALAARSMVGCASLGEALQAGFAVYRLAVEDFKPQLRLTAGPAPALAQVSLVLRATPPVATGLQSVFLYSVRGVASWLVQHRIPLVEVCLHSTRPLKRYGEERPAFHVPIRFHAGASCMSFEARWLSQPVRVDASDLAVFLREMPSPVLAPFRHRSSLQEQVRQRLKAGLGGLLPSLEQTAWALKLSPHMLRRRLLQEGRSFQDIKNDLRRDVAIDRLVHSRDKLAQIAAELGFSECSAFHRSFKQWTGLSPGEYREAALSSGEAGRIEDPQPPAAPAPGR